MNSSRIGVAFLLLLTVTGLGCRGSPDRRDDLDPDRFLVVFDPSAVPSASDPDSVVAAIVSELGGTLVWQNTFNRLQVLIQAPRGERDELMDRYRSDPRVRAVSWNSFSHPAIVPTTPPTTPPGRVGAP